jgi:hypothetical protein
MCGAIELSLERRGGALPSFSSLRCSESFRESAVRLATARRLGEKTTKHDRRKL